MNLFRDFKEILEKSPYKLHPELEKIIDEENFSLHEAICLARLPQDRQADLAQRIETITLKEYKSLLIEAQSHYGQHRCWRAKRL